MHCHIGQYLVDGLSLVASTICAIQTEGIHISEGIELNVVLFFVHDTLALTMS